MPRPRSIIGVTTEPAATIDRQTAAVTRGPDRTRGRDRATMAKSADAAATATPPLVIARAVAGSRTSAKVSTLAHMSVAPAAAASAPSHDNVRTLSHPGEKSSRENS
jgi:hypothetical protein